MSNGVFIPRFFLTLGLVASLLRTPAVERVLSALKEVKEKNTYWIARCPAHEDDRASLSIGVGRDGRALVKCHAGCNVAAVLSAIGLRETDLFANPPHRPRENGGGRPDPDPRDRARLVATYPYHDEQGQLLYEVCRFEPKTFRQRIPTGTGDWKWGLGDTRRVLYHLPQVLAAIAASRPVFLVEGEKDADTLIAQGWTATTNAMGAGKWYAEYTASLRGAQVIILPDNDEPGRAHAETVAAQLHAGGATWVRVLHLPNQPPKGDVSDWFADGHDKEELVKLLDVPEWRPSPERKTRWLLREILENEDLMRPPPAVIPRLAWRSRSTLFAMEEKGGKSTLISFAASCVSIGGTFLGDRCERGPVLLVGLEEFLGDMARRLRHFEADQDRVYIVDKFLRDPHERPEELREHIQAADPAVVFVDTLAAYSEGVISDATSSSQMQPVVQRLTRLARETSIALVLVHHARRSDGRYRDSSAIGGAVDVIVECFIPEPDADPSLRRARSRGRVPVSGFDFRYTDGTFALADPGSKLPLEQRIVAIVRGNPGCSQRAVQEGVGARWQDTQKLIEQMLSDGRLTFSGSGTRRKLYVPANSAPLFGDKS